MDFKFTVNRTIQLEETTSTQDVAKELAALFKEDRILIITKRQTAGRGRFERVWESKEGGLYFSLILRPNAKTMPLDLLSIKAGRVVAQTLKDLYNIKSKIKLPNDVLAFDGKDYKKISGILIETSAQADGGLDWIALGIGIDTNNSPSKKLNAASVKQLTKKQADNQELLQKFLHNFAKEYVSWNMA